MAIVANGIVSLSTGSLQTNFQAIGGIVTGAVSQAFIGLPVTGAQYVSGTSEPVADAWAGLSKAGEGLGDVPEMHFLASQFSQASGSVIHALNYLNGAVSSSNDAAGSDTEVQFNNSDEFGADSSFVFTDASKTVGVNQLNAAGAITGAMTITVPEGKLILGSTAVGATAAEINLLDTAAADTVLNSKAVIYSSAGALTGTAITSPSGNFLFVSGSDVTTNKVFLRGAEVTTTAAELNFNDGATAGTAVASKTVVLDSAKSVSGLDEVSLASLTASATVTIPDGKLILNSTAVGATAAELNVLDGVTAGTAAASKGLVLDANASITDGIHGLEADSITGSVAVQAPMVVATTQVSSQGDISSNGGITCNSLTSSVHIGAAALTASGHVLAANIQSVGHVRAASFIVGGTNSAGSAADFTIDVAGGILTVTEAS